MGRWKIEGSSRFLAMRSPEGVKRSDSQTVRRSAGGKVGSSRHPLQVDIPLPRRLNSSLVSGQERPTGVHMSDALSRRHFLGAAAVLAAGAAAPVAAQPRLGSPFIRK